MGKALVVFGSISDELIYSKIVEGLKAKGIEVELRICSAHRTPQLLEKILSETTANIIVAGAGLSAALPGVTASHTTKPVIGVPCAGNFAGLDAMLSVEQMPQGIPVLAVSVGNTAQVVDNVAKALEQRTGVILVANPALEGIEKPLKKAKEVLQQFNIPFSEVDEPEYKNGSNIYLEFVDLEQGPKTEIKDSLVIYCPIKKDSTAEDALKLLEATQQGLWVGLGRGENAALGAVQIRNLGGKYTQQLREFRKAMAEGVVEADEKESKKWSS